MEHLLSVTHESPAGVRAVVATMDDGAQVGTAVVRVLPTGTALLDVHGSPVAMVEPLLEWCARRRAAGVRVDLGAAAQPGPYVAQGFTRVGGWAAYGRPLWPADAVRRATAPVTPVELDDGAVGRLVKDRFAATGLTAPGDHGADILATLRLSAETGARVAVWRTGPPTEPTGAVAAEVRGRIGGIALIAVSASAPRGTTDDLLATALPALVEAGAAEVTAQVATGNSRSERLNMRYGMRRRGQGSSWWRPC